MFDRKDPRCNFLVTLNPRLKTASQCYSDTLNGWAPFVSLYCGSGQLIDVVSAFHGQHRNQNIDHCGLLEGDCLDNVLGDYDWSRCQSHHYCLQLVQNMTSYVSCRSVDKALRLSYLQVWSFKTVFAAE